jgi:phosphonate transport system substrate-binding protein
LRRWRRGVPEHHAVFFTKKNSGIKRLQNFVGKKIAFEHPISGMGYLAPKFFLLQKGFTMSLKKDFYAPVGPKEIGYVFSNDDENTMAWILRGKIEAGAMSNERYHSEARGSISDLAVVDRTFSVPRQVISHRKNLRAALVARIKKTLMEMDRSEQGRKVLEDFERTSKFDEIPAQSKSRLIALGEWVATELALK